MTVIRPAGAPAGHTGDLPWVKLRSASSGHNVFRRMIDQVDPKARPGDIVAVYDKSDAPYGLALYNPRSLMSLRILHRGRANFDLETFFAERLKRAIEHRADLGIDKASDAYRLVFDQGDGLPGLVIDRYGDFFSLEFYTLGMFRQAERLERLLKARYQNARFVHRASAYTEKMEGFQIKSGPPARTRVKENGVLFDVDLTGGHKTGFFCDQRDNRLALTALTANRKVLDVCSYTGGFGLYAKKLGGAREATCVELDPEAVEIQKKNANINGVRLDSVCVDAFPYLRQAIANKQSFDVVILDPYKLIASKEGYELGRKKYGDLNRLGFGVVEQGGIVVTCSCSGLLGWEEFQQIVRTAAGSSGRRVQIFRKSGAGADHPIAADNPEGEYLKVLWCRVL